MARRNSDETPPEVPFGEVEWADPRRDCCKTGFAIKTAIVRVIAMFANDPPTTLGEWQFVRIVELG